MSDDVLLKKLIDSSARTCRLYDHIESWSRAGPMGYRIREEMFAILNLYRDMPEIGLGKVDAVIAERERCTEVLHQLTHRIAEYLYGHTREQAVEWAKSDKYDSDAARAMDILDICKHAINGR